MKYVTRRPETVDAVRYKGVINDEIIDILEDRWGLFYFDYNDLYIYNELNKPKKVEDGEMIVLYSNGLLGVEEETEFNKEYKECHHESVEVDLAISAKPRGISIN